MKKNIYKIFAVLITLFIFTNNVNAECSYQERKALLNSTKNVTYNMNVATKEVELQMVNPSTDEVELKKIETNYFQMNITGVTEDFFIKITNNFNYDEVIVNDTNTENGAYTLDIENIDDIYTYTLTFYSTNDNCYAEKITSKKIKKPKENTIYYYSICSNEEVKDNKYCAQFIDSDFNKSEDEIIQYLSSIIDGETEQKEIEEEKKSIINTLKNYWYIPVTIIGIALVILIIIFIQKKRGEL